MCRSGIGRRLLGWTRFGLDESIDRTVLSLHWLQNEFWLASIVSAQFLHEALSVSPAMDHKTECLLRLALSPLGRVAGCVAGQGWAANLVIGGRGQDYQSRCWLTVYLDCSRSWWWGQRRTCRRQASHHEEVVESAGPPSFYPGPAWCKAWPAETSVDANHSTRGSSL